MEIRRLAIVFFFAFTAALADVENYSCEPGPYEQELCGETDYAYEPYDSEWNPWEEYGLREPQGDTTLFDAWSRHALMNPPLLVIPKP